MPRVSRYQHRRMATITRDHLHELYVGYPDLDGFGLQKLETSLQQCEHAKPTEAEPLRHERDELRELMRLVWDALRADLLGCWVIENPATRPWSWWEWDAPEPRRLVSGPGNHSLTDPSSSEFGRRWFGLPTVLVVEDHHDPSVYEGEGQYLDRIGLFAPGERKRWQAAPPPPEDDDGWCTDVRTTLDLVGPRVSGRRLNI